MQVWLTALMIDVCAVFRYDEKETKKPHIIVPDILRYRDIAIEKLNLLKDKQVTLLVIHFQIQF